MRYKDLTPYEVTLFLEEERSLTEVGEVRKDESIGYLAVWTSVRVDDTSGNNPTPTEITH